MALQSQVGLLAQRHHRNNSLDRDHSNAVTGLLERSLLMLWTILVIILILWLIGFLAKLGGGLIHLLLVVALVVLIIQLITGRRV
jgi:hypothetical protein